MASSFFFLTGVFASDGFLTVGGGTVGEAGAPVEGTDFSDRIRGGREADRIAGLGGDDTLEGEEGADELLGGEGADSLTGSEDADRLDGGEGDDFASGGRGADRLLGGPGADLLRGNAGSDGLEGGDGDDLLDGGPGEDTLEGGEGDDLLDGGGGDDTAVYDVAFGAAEVVRAGPDSLDVILEDGSADRLDFVERVVFADGVLEVGAATAEEALVWRLFDAVYGRAPGQGFAFWVDRLEAGASPGALAEAFAATPEYAARYGGDAGAVVDGLYAHVLGRAPAEAGRAHWLGRLEDGMSEGALLLGFTESAEAVAAHADLLDAGLFLAL